MNTCLKLKLLNVFTVHTTYLEIKLVNTADKISVNI